MVKQMGKKKKTFLFFYILRKALWNNNTIRVAQDMMSEARAEARRVVA